jgi:hypothetical protein
MENKKKFPTFSISECNNFHIRRAWANGGLAVPVPDSGSDPALALSHLTVEPPAEIAPWHAR